MATAKNNTKKNEKAEKAERTNLYLRGVITEAMYGKREFKRGSDSKDKYRISLKVVPEDMEKLIEAAEPYYENTDSKWLPKWYTDEDAREYLNLSSNFDLKIGMKNEAGQLEDLGTMMSYIEANGNINGSKVIIMVTLKEGAIYPQAILIKELHQTNISDLFKDADGFMDFDGGELPFD